MEIIKVVQGSTGKEVYIKAHLFNPSKHVSLEEQVPVVEELVEAKEVAHVVDYSKMKKAELVEHAVKKGMAAVEAKKNTKVKLISYLK
jgi:6,7-dimethyl-8-ribityllumazine synthase